MTASTKSIFFWERWLMNPFVNPLKSWVSVNGQFVGRDKNRNFLTKKKFISIQEREMEMINGRKYRSHSHGDDNVALHYLPTPLKLSLDALWLNWLPSLPHLLRPDTTAAWEKFFLSVSIKKFLLNQLQEFDSNDLWLLHVRCICNCTSQGVLRPRWLNDLSPLSYIPMISL